MIHLEKRIIALAGLPLTGKTSLGNELAKKTDAVVLDVDEARQEIAPGKDWLGPDKEREIMLAAYKHNHERAREILKTGRAAILIATYSRPTYHQMLKELSSGEGVPLDVFLLEIPDSTVIERIEKRKVEGSSSNIESIESYTEVKGRYQPPEHAAVLDATQAVEKMAAFVLESLVQTS